MPDEVDESDDVIFSDALIPEQRTPKATGAADKKPRRTRLPTCPHCGKKIQTRSSHYEITKADGTIEIWCYTCASGDSTTCDHCGRRHPRSESVSVEGSSSEWCPQCAEKHSFICDRCGKRHRKTGSRQVLCTPKGAPRWEAPPTTMPASVNISERFYHGVLVQQTWCADCLHMTIGCDTCGRRHSLELMSAMATGGCECPSCLNKLHEEGRLLSCCRCGKLVRRECTVTHSGFPGPICSVCDAQLGEQTRGQIYSYHGFPKPLKFFRGTETYEPRKRAVPNDLYLGFELEAGKATQSGVSAAVRDLHALDPEEDHFHLERDSSIPSYGFELISAPHTLSAHMAYEETWRKAFAAEVKHGLRSHDCGGNCGLHVHVSRSYLTGSDCAKLDIFIQRNKLFWQKVARREEVYYAKYIQKGSLAEYGNSPDRYCALNFRKSGTVEFRMYRGTLKFETFMGVLELTDAVCRWIKTRNCVQIARNHAEVKGLLNFMKGDKKQYGRAIKYIIRTTADRQAEEQANPEL